MTLTAPAKAAPRVSLTSCVRRAGQAQKRFRERQKTKFTELTSKVEQLEARLASALVEKAKSEDRASILEKCLELRGNLPVAASSGAAIGEVRAVQHECRSMLCLPAGVLHEQGPADGGQQCSARPCQYSAPAPPRDRICICIARLLDTSVGAACARSLQGR